MTPTRDVPTFCRICEPCCGLVAGVENGRIESLRPDRDHPVTRGLTGSSFQAFWAMPLAAMPNGADFNYRDLIVVCDAPFAAVVQRRRNPDRRAVIAAAFVLRIVVAIDAVVGDQNFGPIAC